MSYLTLTPETLPGAHICCAFSDSKCAAGTAAKKAWLAREYQQGWRFHRLDARAKVFVEYGPAATAWLPVEADDAMMMGCFWVSGRYARNGHGRALLDHVMAETRAAGLRQVVTLAGRRKFHFLSDGKWLKAQGFTVADRLDSGFELLARDLGGAAPPRFADNARRAEVEPAGVSVWYSDRCPYAGFHVTRSLPEACKAHGLALHLHKIETRAQARAAPTPATIFSLFLNGRFVTTDLGTCLPARFDKMLARQG